MIEDRKFFLGKYRVFRRLAEVYLVLYLIAEGYSDHDAMARVGMDPRGFHEIMDEFELKEHVLEARRLGEQRLKKGGRTRKYRNILTSHKRWLSKLEKLEEVVSGG